MLHNPKNYFKGKGKTSIITDSNCQDRKALKFATGKVPLLAQPVAPNKKRRKIGQEKKRTSSGNLA